MANLSYRGKKSACVICGNFCEFFAVERNLGKLLHANGTCRNFPTQLSPPFNKLPASLGRYGGKTVSPGASTANLWDVAPIPRWTLPNELNVLALLKGQEHYIFIYDDESRPQLIDNFRDVAADPQYSLSWFDAMVLTTKAREQETMEATPLAPESGIRDQESGIRDQGSGVREQESEDTGRRFFDA